ncbi:ABC protein, partial [Rhizoctonia solani]
MSFYALQRGTSHMASRELFRRPHSHYFGIMRQIGSQKRKACLNPLHVPFRSAHTLSRHQLPLHTSPSLLWLLVPLGGGLLMYSRETPPSISSILSSPNIIPRGAPPQLIRIDSPYESQTSLISQLHEFLRSRIWEPIRTGFRFLHLVTIFIPVILTAPILLIGSPEDRYGGDRWGAVWWYGLLVKAMQRAGPTFIKLSQWAGSREDLFPAVLCEKLGSLHSNGKPHRFSHTRRVIERVFGRPFDEVFEAFEESPIGVGAIAQVYRATLKSDLHPFTTNSTSDSVDQPGTVPAFTQAPKTSVAIKILHPHVRKHISRDLTILSVFASAIDMIPGLEWLSLPDEVRVFGEMMQQQIDLRHEARNLVQFEQNFGRDGQGGKSGRVQTAVVFPRPLVNWSTDEVLVEEYADAVPLKYFLRHGGGPFDHRIANLGLDAFLNMLLLDNFVHSDLHPGNIMIKFYKPSTRDMFFTFFSSVLNKSGPPLNKFAHAESDVIVAHLRRLSNSPDEWHQALNELEEDGYQPELVLLDAGLVTVLSEKNRRNFLDLFRAIAEFDGYRAGQLMVQRCRSPHLAIDPDVFALKIQHMVLGVKRKTFSLGKIKIADVLYDVLRAVRTHHVRMEADFVNTVLSLLLLEGIGRQLDPDMDLLKSSLPILRQLGRQTAARDAMAQLPSGNVGAMIKMWVYLEARQLASSTVVNLDELVRYDWLSPNV